MERVIKPSATSAATTAFCAAKVEGPGGFLWIDGNGKITRENGTLDNPKPNAFSLLQIDDCPGATQSCKLVCYVHNLQKLAPDTHRLYQHNSKMIRDILFDVVWQSEWESILGKWIRNNCPGGFRWHVSGDIFSFDYAVFIARVCSFSYGVPHWIYTRSFNFLDPLYSVSTKIGGHLAVNLSCDVDNYEEAKEAAKTYGFRLCYLTLNGEVPLGLPDGSVIFPDYGLRGGNPDGRKWFDGLSPTYKSFCCPVDMWGKTEHRRCGPCDRCLK